MPIDSVCNGCGQTLRVNDEFVGRKARCPMCGYVYMAGETTSRETTTSESKSIDAPSDPFANTVTNPSKAEVASSDQPILEPIADSWATLPTKESDTQVDNAAKPARVPSSQELSSANFAVPSAANPTLSAATTSKYFVRTPNTMVYGPSDTKTVLDWIDQGRLDDSCHIRDEASEQWIGLAAWRFQTRSIQRSPTGPQPSTFNQFGVVPQSAVQSAGYAKSGNGVLVLVLGIASWILCVTAFGAWVCSVLAIVFGVGELKKIRSGESPSKEKTLVFLGIVLGVANLAAWVVLLFGIIILAVTNA